MITPFKYLLSVDARTIPNLMEPFDPMGHFTWWQRVCWKILRSPVYLRRYIDHIQLVAYREHYPKFKARAPKGTRVDIP